jgi:hypothetical protein
MGQIKCGSGPDHYAEINNGKQKDYLSYSVLGLLLREGKIEREANNHKHKAKVER